MGHFSTANGYTRNLEEIARVCRRAEPYSKAEVATAPTVNEPCVQDDVHMGSPEPQEREQELVQEPEQEPVQSDQNDVKMDCAQEVEFSKPAPSAGPEFVKGFGCVLSSWVTAAKATPGKAHKVARFHSSTPPGLAISDYLKRIQKYFFCSDECFVIALVYIDRVSKTDPSMTVCDLTVHRLLFTAVMLATKFHDDKYYSNAYYAKAGGLNLREVNLLEATMLKQLEWRMLVTTDVYQQHLDLVCKSIL